MKKDIERYTSMGLERKMAEYFAGGRRKIVGVIPKEDFSLVISFDNGEIRRFDMTPLLQPNTVFATFAKWEDFRRVYLDSNGCIAWDIDPMIDSNVVWNNKVDLSTDSCYVDSVPMNNGMGEAN